MYEETQNKIQQYLEEGVFPCASGVFMRGNQWESFYLGQAQVQPTLENLTPDMRFDVASLTKVICTTTVVLQLVETGVIALDQPFRDYYPAFEDGKITIRHLLTHTSDINSYIENRDALNQQQLKSAYNHVQSGVKLGQEVVYTDTGTILLGFMLEEIFQKNAIDIFTERVLQPLEMKESCFLPQEPATIVPTENHPKRGFIRGEVHDPKAFVLAEHAGNAGLFTNINDLQKFISMYLAKGLFNDKQLLKSETILSLLQDHTPEKKGQRSLGWDLKKDVISGQPLLFHTGYTGTFILLDLLEGEAFAFLSNRVHPVDQRAAYIEKRDELIQVYLNEKSQ